MSKQKQIEFEWKNRRYAVSLWAADVDKIVLPDGTLLEVNGWTESFPPIPKELVEVSHVFSHMPPQDIAFQFRADLAQELDLD